MATQKENKRWRGVVIGAGYFAGFHLDAWKRLHPRAEIVCVCDAVEERAKQAAGRHGIAEFTSSVEAALDRPGIDFADLATPPAGRLELVELAARRGLALICQKPLAAEFATAKRVIEAAGRSKAPFMVHENFRFQPWYREIKRMLDAGTIGSKLHTIHMRTRLGDGWGEDAYQSRQPYFRVMPRLLMQETGVHYVDTFRYLAGEIVECSASLRRLNPVIAGEDAGIARFRFANGAEAVWDANRYNESLAEDPRYTFGELLVEANEGSLWLGFDGEIRVKRLGEAPYRHEYSRSKLGFAGDCVYACQRHFLDVLDGAASCETSGVEYAKSLRVVEALYESHELNRPVAMGAAGPKPVTVDLSLPVSNALRGVEISVAKTRESDGWNATTLKLYSHAGTHMDAPKHFLREGGSLDALDLSVCHGPARVVNLAPAAPRQLLRVGDVASRIGWPEPGERLLIRTDWHRRAGTPEYRDELPRISAELARWLVECGVKLLGVEPPSVADVNNLAELTEVHEILLGGGVTIVEGLANLDRLTRQRVEFIALPLRIVDGDGCPVRAVAVERPEG